MPRRLDPEVHQARRRTLAAGASQVFATHGFERTTTAMLCRALGISSGTFFHYFPTKLAVLVAVLEGGRDDAVSGLSRIEERHRGRDAVLAWTAGLDEELTDPGYAVFVSSLAGVESVPEVAAVLDDERRAVTDFLARHLAEAQAGGEVRQDVPVDRLIVWVRWLADGAAVATAEQHGPPESVTDAVGALLTAR